MVAWGIYTIVWMNFSLRNRKNEYILNLQFLVYFAAKQLIIEKNKIIPLDLTMY